MAAVVVLSVIARLASCCVDLSSRALLCDHQIPVSSSGSSHLWKTSFICMKHDCELNKGCSSRGVHDCQFDQSSKAAAAVDPACAASLQRDALLRPAAKSKSNSRLTLPTRTIPRPSFLTQTSVTGSPARSTSSSRRIPRSMPPIAERTASAIATRKLPRAS